MDLGCRGRNCTMPAMDADLDDARHCFETNVFGVMAMCQAFTPLLIKQKGLIVNIGSVAAVRFHAMPPIHHANSSNPITQQDANTPPPRSSPMSSAASTTPPKPPCMPIPAHSVSNSRHFPYVSWSW